MAEVRLTGLAGPSRLQEPSLHATRDAAEQFEALLLTQMLRSARAAGDGGWLGTGEDQASSSLMELGEEQMARVLAAQGGLGLARLVVQGLTAPPPAGRP